MNEINRSRGKYNVDYTNFLFGEWDIMVKLVDSDANLISDFVSHIRSIRGVADTKVLTGISW
jgi:hypothetical protein